jgi:hypothetical protein
LINIIVVIKEGYKVKALSSKIKEDYKIKENYKVKKVIK